MAADNYGQEGFPINALAISVQGDEIALAAGIYPGQNGFIQRSTDIGATWETVFNLPAGSGKFNSLFQRKDSMNIFLALNEGLNYEGLLLADVKNYPDQWDPSPGTSGLNFLFPASFNNEKVYFLVNDSLFYKSNDGGRTVEYVSVIPGGKYNSIYAANVYNAGQRIYACGQGVKYSSDFGLTWNDFGLNQYEVVRLVYESWSLLAATKNDGYFVKYHSVGNWEPFSIGLGKGKVIVEALNYTSWVLHTATENHSVYFLWLIINDAAEGEGFIPGKFVLAQNYPNPFNPLTKVKYSVPQLSKVSIKVYDILGKEVAALVNEEKPAGLYEVNWNASDFPSGVYFYRLQTDNFIQTKKMILIK